MPLSIPFEMVIEEAEKLAVMVKRRLGGLPKRLDMAMTAMVPRAPGSNGSRSAHRQETLDRGIGKRAVAPAAVAVDH
jgi:hypothetical protein